jgi:hypothetical protein
MPRNESLPLYGTNDEDLDADGGASSPFHEDADVEASDACLWTLRGFSTVTAFAGLLVVVVNAIEIYEFQETPQIYAIRAYAIIFGFMILMAEVNWPRAFLEYFRFLDVWATKGLFILFVAVLTIDTKASNDYGTLQLATACAVGVLGFVYLCLGLMCVKACRDMRKATLSKERERCAAEAAKARARSNEAFAMEEPSRQTSASVQSDDSRSPARPTWLDEENDK